MLTTMTSDIPYDVAPLIAFQQLLSVPSLSYQVHFKSVLDRLPSVDSALGRVYPTDAFQNVAADLSAARKGRCR